MYEELERKHLTGTPLPSFRKQETCSDLYDQNHLHLGKKLGAGLYGSVFEGCTKGQKEACDQAVKVSSLLSDKDRQIWEQEVRGLGQLQDTKLVPKLYRAFRCSDDDAEKGIVIEDKYDGDFHSLMQDPFYKEFLRKESNREKILGRAYRILQEIQKNKLINLDPNAGNFLYKRTTPRDPPRIVMADLGWAKPFTTAYPDDLDLGTSILTFTTSVPPTLKLSKR